MDKQTVHLFVFDTLSDWEPMYAVAAINNPAFQQQPGRYEVKTVGLDQEPVKTTGGLTILPDMTMAELDAAYSAMLILPGGSGWGEGRHKQASDKARELLAHGVPVAAICGATAGLALAGMLDDRPHTGNWPGELEAIGYKGAAHFQHQPAVTDGNLITASGTAPLDFAYQIARKLEIYSDQVLEAWYGLYKTNDPKYFFELQSLCDEAGASPAPTVG
ncbi:type 1 glutamine amidotransferase family protein [Dictyobacter aurantiacus]|uniref:Putative protease YoaZ n=1 Tax=Dictyobacter aurantiacus TaxID=1936993 RepID=A0A401ZMU5_9CHLR|nr:type 1 glutamine amidotransferase family protein [Dictyobacter aurantiacus]GCE08182.1 putative protease YoaZ [Dictyobacter aurantiacus]